MEEGGDVMVSSEEASTSQDRTDYSIPVHLEQTPSKFYNTDDSNSSDVPEYATITRLRQHDPPYYSNHKEDTSLSRKNTEEAELSRKDEAVPEDDIGVSRSRDKEDEIEVLGPLLEEEPKQKSANGCPPVGWVTLSMGSNGTKGNDGDDLNSAAAERNAKILEQFEDKQKDECLVDCLYYTTTCCECVIL